MVGNAQPEMTGFDADKVSRADLPTRFFSGGSRSELLDQIVHLTRFGMMAVNVSGSAGTGKTHLMQAVGNTLQGSVITVKASLLMSSSELLNQILREVLALRFHHDLPDLPSTTDEQALLSIINSYFLRLKDTGSNVVILVDDAHELSEEAIQVLLKLVLDKSHYENLKCVLFSEPYFSTLLTKPAIKEAGAEQVFTLHVPLMDKKVTEEYLSFLESAKPDSDKILYTDSDIQTIFSLSEGNLGQVNSAVRSLLEEDSKDKRSVSSFPWQTIGFSLTALVIIVIAFLYNAERSVQENALDSGTLVLSESTPREEETQKVDVVSNSLPDERKDSSLLEQLRLKQKELLAANEVLAEKPQALTTDEIKIPPSMSGKSSEVNQAPIAVSSVLDKQLDDPLVSGAKKGAKVSTPKLTDFNVEKSDDSYNSKRWISSRPGNFYTIQILGAHSKKNVTRYIDSYSGDKTQLAIYEGVLRGQSWFVLIHGSYENRKLAKLAGKELPIKDVWIRSFSSVQKEMIR